MKHPFESLARDEFKWLFGIAVVFYVVIQLLFAWLDMALRTSAAPNGIISFELAGSVQAAQAMIDSWNAMARLDASFGLGIDFLFMAAYSTMIGLACIWAGRQIAARGWVLSGLGGTLAWGLWVAVVCDSIENTMLLAQLFYGVAEPRPQIAALCATVKFALILLGLLYALYGAGGWLGEAGRRRSVLGR